MDKQKARELAERAADSANMVADCKFRGMDALQFLACNVSDLAKAVQELLADE